MKKNSPVLPLLFLAAALAGCAAAPDGKLINDPYEQANRQVHDFNTGLDKALLRPASEVTEALPDVLTDRVVDFADNLALPGMVVNGLLQGDLESAISNTFRFVVNTTIGVGGLFDPADEAGLYEKSTDFGQTLAVWGVPEGAYVVLPFLGPSTERDTFGLIVDFAFDPLQFLVPPEVQEFQPYAFVGKKVISRGRFGATVDSLLYESADPYAQARLLYLQSRRFDLGVPVDSAYMEGGVDPYADPYADFIDPYEDF
jgi:phospholipid-binding lipoprotein MlaA